MYPWKEPWKELVAVVVIAVIIMGAFGVYTIMWHQDAHRGLSPYVSSFTGSLPPRNITLHNVNVTNNHTIPILNYGVAALSSMVGIVALIMTIMGVFLTLEIIGVGNFRQHFITSLEMCKAKKVDMNKEAMMRRWLFLYHETTLVDIARVRTKKIYANSKVLGLLNIIASFLSIFTLFCVMYIIFFCCSVHIDELWTYFWRLLLFYVFCLIGIVTSIFIYVGKIVSYPDLAELHKALAEHIIGEITKDKEKVQQENTDSKSKQKTPPEKAEDKKEP